MNERIKVSINFQNQLEEVFNSYIKLKDELVNEDANNAMLTSKIILENISQVDMKQLTDKNAHNHWMTIEKEIKVSANSISKSSDIKVQRDHFKHLSSHLINAIKLFGINKKVFVDFCPMANNNKGAYWLSKQQKITNPYYGQAMLSCGEVKQILE
jgi:Cu(I)/Ag(I) efflux system membrane fusion protein